MDTRIFMPGAGPALPRIAPSPQARVRTSVAKYIPAEWDGVNNSGHLPIGNLVVVLADVAEDVTTGGIIAGSPMEQERVSAMAETGTLVAVGDQAFTYQRDRIHKWEGRKPAVGDRIHMERFAGGPSSIVGHDGKFYRVFEDKCISGLLIPPASKESSSDA